MDTKAETFRKKRRKAERHGRYSEYIAALFLRLRGYRVLEMRHRNRLGEIDLIMVKGELVIFVEVKARGDEMLAVNAVSASSQQRIRAASDVWLAKQRHASRLSQRYDIVAVLPWKLPRHFPGAF